MLRLKFKPYRLILTALILSAFIFSVSPVFALEQEVADRYSVKTPPEEGRPPSILDRITTRFYFDLRQGYDNNAYLNSQRYEDGFFQSLASFTADYKMTDAFNIFGGVEMFETVYYKYHRNNLFDVAPYLGGQYAITPDIFWKAWALYDFACYPCDDESTYSGLELRTAVRHYITDNIWHELGYGYINRWYHEWEIMQENTLIGDDNRHDWRNELNYVVKIKVNDRLSFRIGNWVYYNDSNFEFQDYFDYFVYKIKPSVTFYLTKRLYSDTSFIWECKHYDDRKSTEDINKDVKENTYIVSTSLYYDINKNVTVGVTYTYSEDDPNDPYYKYSGSIITGGVYCNF